MFTRGFGQFRSYYAAAIVKVRNIPARVVQSATEVALKTYEPHNLYSGYFYSPFEDNFIVSAWKFLQRSIPLSSWGTRFVINQKGQIALNPEVIDSTEQLQECQKSGGRFASYVYYHPPGSTPDLLYSIDQSAWDQFISHLPDQSVATQLNLSHHRHMWPAYNYAIDAHDFCRKSRARYFSEFHFLLSYITPTYRIYMGNNLEAKLISGLSESAETVLHLIDRNQSPVGELLKMLKLPNAALLNKFSHCPHSKPLESISEFVISKATNEHMQINISKVNEFVAALPSSKKNPIEFSLMVQESQNLQDVLGTIHFSKALPYMSYFFYHKRKNFGEDTKLKMQAAQMDDFVIELMKHLVYPEYIRQVLRFPDLAEQMLNYNREIIEEALFITRTFILNHASPKSLVSLSERWHRNLAVIANLKPAPLDHICTQWHELFTETVLDGVTFTCLTTDESLKKEGTQLGHCVGGYADRCKRNDCHIVRAMTPNGERATIELHSYNGVFFINQSKSTRNAEPTLQIQQASQKLLAAINQGTLKLNPHRGRILSEASGEPLDPNMQMLANAHEIYPYDFNDANTQEQLYSAFKNNKVLPAPFNAISYTQMLIASKIRDSIHESMVKFGAPPRTDISLRI